MTCLQNFSFQWLFQEIYNVRPDNGVKSGPTQQRFVLATGGSSGRKEMVFVSEFRNEILTHILRVSGVKLGWAEGEKPVFLEIGAISVDQIDRSSGRPVACYTYKDIETVAKVSGLNGGIAIIHGGHGRLHLFRCSDVDNFVNSLVEAAMHYMGISIHVQPDPLELESCRQQRFGDLATPEAMISQAEFVVQKVAPYRYGPDAQPITRTLCLTESLLVERDPVSYRAVCVQPLCEVFSLIRYRREPHQFSIEYLRGKVHTYFSSDRFIRFLTSVASSLCVDSLVCSILDGVRASGNDGVYVRSSNSRRGLRVLPMSVPSSEEVESMHLRFLRQPPEGTPFWETVERFNANVAYSGLVHAVTQDGVFAENKEKLIKDALTVLLTRFPSIAVNDNFRELDAGLTDQEIFLQKMESRFQAIRRLFASKAGFQSFTQLPGIRENLGRAVVSALAMQDDGLTHIVIDAVNTLMQPMHASPDIRQEQLNKTSIMSSSVFMAQLVNVFTLHALRGTGSLVITALLDFFTFAICQPYSETSEGESFETLLALVASRGRALFRLFCHPSLAIIKGAGLVMRALIEEAPDVIVAELRQMSLAEGALLQHLSTACFSNCSRDPRGLVLRQLSRILVTLWTENNIPAQDLLRRIFPDGLLCYLDSPDAPPREEKDHLYVRDNLLLAQEHVMRVQQKKSETLYVLQEKLDGLLQHWRTKIGLQAKPPSAPVLEEKPVALRLSRKTRLKLCTNDTTVNGVPQTPPKQLNWPMFYYQFNEDHAKPDLIWNLRAREPRWVFYAFHFHLFVLPLCCYLSFWSACIVGHSGRQQASWTRDELRDALEKEVGEFHRECDFFSFSRLEEPALGDSSETFDATNLMTEEQQTARESINSQSPDQGVDVAAECSSPDDSTDISTSQNASVAKWKKSDGNSTMDRLEHEVELLIKQANMVSWNHSEFRVRYASLSTEPQVANYFLRLLLEEDKRVSSANQKAPADGTEPLGLLRIKNSREFFNELFRRYLQYAAAGSAVLSKNASNNPAAAKSLRLISRRQEKRNHRLNMRCLCLHAMAIVYGRCHSEIGPVSDIPLLVHLLDRTVSAAERDCLLMLLEKLVLNKYNADEFLEADGVRVVTDLAGLAHLHTSRAPPPTETNILMGGDDPDSQQGGGVTQREWWYWKTDDNNTGSSTGPLSFAEVGLLLSKTPSRSVNTLMFTCAFHIVIAAVIDLVWGK
ncbi:unnamed protein product [Schistocephalus solidus]|uniref:J domain-containing protein n=1 Tax=Schistocephalus solidus TaxID=70667 RepID=A0A183T130_SCHSO|nr:unnamed protein product [Schistocephalus solidus]